MLLTPNSKSIIQDLSPEQQIRVSNFPKVSLLECHKNTADSAMSNQTHDLHPHMLVLFYSLHWWIAPPSTQASVSERWVSSQSPFSLLFSTSNWLPRPVGYTGSHPLMTYWSVFFSSYSLLLPSFKSSLAPTLDNGHIHLAGPASKCISFNSFSTQSPNVLFKIHRRSNYPIV